MLDIATNQLLTYQTQLSRFLADVTPKHRACLAFNSCNRVLFEIFSMVESVQAAAKNSARLLHNVKMARIPPSSLWVGRQCLDDVMILGRVVHAAGIAFVWSSYLS